MRSLYSSAVNCLTKRPNRYLMRLSLKASVLCVILEGRCQNVLWRVFVDIVDVVVIQEANSG